MIDLHTHSTYSDGRSTPEELMREAAHAGLKVVGLTDHDTIGGWEGAAACVKSSGVSLVRGMEISAKLEGIPVHLLAYLFDPDEPNLRRHHSRLLEEREGRAKEMVARIGRDFPLAWEDVQKLAGGPVGRPHIADGLIARGVVKNRDEAFERFLLPDSPYYIPHYAPCAHDVLEWVNRAGGKLVMAHPDAPRRGSVVSHQAIMGMAEAGMFGLEVDHRDNYSPENMAKLAQQCGLVRIGSSDYHGCGKANRLGENTTTPEAFSLLVSNTFLEVLVP